MFFRGISKISVDAKGRFSLPKQRREQLQASGVSTVVVTADPARCLLVYPMSEWQQFEAQIVALPNAHPAARQYQRDYAGIGKKGVLIGQGKKFELWDVDRFDEQSEKWADELNELPPAEVPEFIQNLTI